MNEEHFLLKRAFRGMQFMQYLSSEITQKKKISVSRHFSLLEINTWQAKSIECEIPVCTLCTIIHMYTDNSIIS